MDSIFLENLKRVATSLCGLMEERIVWGGHETKRSWNWLYFFRVICGPKQDIKLYLNTIQVYLLWTMIEMSVNSEKQKNTYFAINNSKFIP